MLLMCLVSLNGSKNLRIVDTADYYNNVVKSAFKFKNVAGLAPWPRQKMIKLTTSVIIVRGFIDQGDSTLFV